MTDKITLNSPLQRQQDDGYQQILAAIEETVRNKDSLNKIFSRYNASVLQQGTRFQQQSFNDTVKQIAKNKTESQKYHPIDGREPLNEDEIRDLILENGHVTYVAELNASFDEIKHYIETKHHGKSQADKIKHLIICGQSFETIYGFLLMHLVDKDFITLHWHLTPDLSKPF